MARQRIVIGRTTEVERPLSAETPDSGGGGPGLTAVLLVAVLCCYGGLALFRRATRQKPPPALEAESFLPPRSEVRGAWQPPAESVPPPAPSAAPPPEDDPAAPIRWDHASFLRGARLFNGALAQYRQHLTDRRNPETLKTVERDCRAAIAAFEECKSVAPADVNVAALIDRCCRLISDARHATLLTPGRPP